MNRNARPHGSENDSESEADATDESRGTWELPGDNHNPHNSKPSSLAGQLMRQFREAMKALTQPAHEPKPQSRTKRKGNGETGRAFRMTAGKITRRLSVRTLITHATDFVWNTLDWLHIWDGNHDDTFEPYEDFPPPRHDDHHIHL